MKPDDSPLFEPTLDASFTDSQSLPALPDQLPAKLDLSQIPLAILRTGSMEALIAQNEDLMSRLTVTLKRMGLLEDELATTRSENAELEQQNRNLSDLQQVADTKDEYWKEHLLKAEEKAAFHLEQSRSTQQELTLLESRYAELQDLSEKKEMALSAHLQQTQKRLKRFQKYRTRIQTLSVKLRDDFFLARTKIEELGYANHDLKDRVQSMVDHIQTQSREHERVREQLILTYENKTNELQRALDDALKQCQEQIARNEMLDKLVVDQVALENRAIFAERKIEQLQNQYQSDLEKLERDYLNLRQGHDLLERSHQELQNESQVAQTSLSQLKDENLKLRAQVESVQALWNEERGRCEKLSNQEHALQRLNQELSQKLHQMRRELQAQKDLREVGDVRGPFELTPE